MGRETYKFVSGEQTDDKVVVLMDREVRAVPLAVRVIPNVDPELGAQLQVKPHIRSLGILTCTIDDVGYTAIDEATKKADVEVVYAKSFLRGFGACFRPVIG